MTEQELILIATEIQGLYELPAVRAPAGDAHSRSAAARAARRALTRAPSAAFVARRPPAANVVAAGGGHAG